MIAERDRGMVHVTSHEAKGSGEPLQSIIIGIDIDRELRRKRITERLHKRLEEGMVDEVRHLLDEGIPPENLMYYGLEYKFLTMYIIGKITYSEMVSQLEIAIHQFAKRQMTWFRGMERRGLKINWLERPENDQQLGVLIEEIRALVRKSE